MKSFRPFAVLFVLASVLSALVVMRLRLSKDLTELFPRTPEATALARVTRVFGGGDVALLLVTGEEPNEVARAAHDAAVGLRSVESVAQVLEGPPAPKTDGAPDPTAAWRFADPEAREKLAAALTEEGMRRQLLDTRALLLAPGAGDVEELIARDPLRLSMIPWEGRIELAAGASGAPGGAFVSGDGRARLVVIEPRGRAFDSAAARLFATDTDRALLPVRSAHPGTLLELTGGHVIAKETEAMMRGDLEKSSIVSMVLASVVFVLTFRRARALIAVLPPLAAGTLWTTAIAALVYPELSAIATAFCAVVIGVGVDTGVHVYGRLLEARREGHAPAEAARIARATTWRPTLGAAVAAGGAFACLALSDISGMRQLGVLCGVGEVLTAVAILVVVPDVGAWLERGAPPPPMRLPFVSSVTATRGRSLVALSGAFACLAVALAFGAPTLDHGVVALDAKTLPAMATYEKIYATFGGTRGQLVVVSADADVDKARARADAVGEVASLLQRDGTIAGFDALGTVAPSLAAQRMRLAERDKLDWPAARARLERTLEELGFSKDAFAPALEAFAHPTEVVGPSPLEADADAAWLVRRHLGSDERGHLAVTFVRLTRDPAKDAMARATLRAADPEAIVTGYAELETSLRDSLARDLPRVMMAAMGMVLFVLAISLRRVGAVLLAVLVLVVEVALVLVLARLVGARWHVYDALVLPVLLGITLDEALFLLDAESERGIEEALAQQAPLAMATALTTAAGFGALLICRFGGLMDVGKIGALGSIVGLVSALVLIPAGLRVARLRLRRRS